MHDDIFSISLLIEHQLLANGQTERRLAM